MKSNPTQMCLKPDTVQSRKPHIRRLGRGSSEFWSFNQFSCMHRYVGTWYRRGRLVVLDSQSTRSLHMQARVLPKPVFRTGQGLQDLHFPSTNNHCRDLLYLPGDLPRLLSLEGSSSASCEGVNPRSTVFTVLCCFSVYTFSIASKQQSTINNNNSGYFRFRIFAFHHPSTAFPRSELQGIQDCRPTLEIILGIWIKGGFPA
jgi:hypothetical protein